MQVINPDIRVVVSNIWDERWDSADESVQLDIEIDIEKDTDGEPDQATVTIYQLNDSTINLLAGNALPDIAIYYAPFGQSETLPCYVGQIVHVETHREGTDRYVVLFCESHTFQARDKYINYEYALDTDLQIVIDDITSEIGLPVQSVDIPNRQLFLSTTFSGPAFLLLQEVLEPLSMFAFIQDGVLKISSVFEPCDGTVADIQKKIQVSEPQVTLRRDITDLAFNASSSNQKDCETYFVGNDDKIKKTEERTDGENTTEAISDEIKGKSCELLGIPNIQPDQVVRFEEDENLYRVKRVSHVGDRHSGVVTTIYCDLFGGRP